MHLGVDLSFATEGPVYVAVRYPQLTALPQLDRFYTSVPFGNQVELLSRWES